LAFLRQRSNRAFFTGLLHGSYGLAPQPAVARVIFFVMIRVLITPLHASRSLTESQFVILGGQKRTEFELGVFFGQDHAIPPGFAPMLQKSRNNAISHPTVKPVGPQQNWMKANSRPFTGRGCPFAQKGPTVGLINDNGKSV
jgi:hypothetical protein